MKQKFNEYLPEYSKGGCKQMLELSTYPQGRKPHSKKSRLNQKKKDDEKIKNSKDKQSQDTHRICMSIQAWEEGDPCMFLTLGQAG